MLYKPVETVMSDEFVNAEAEMFLFSFLKIKFLKTNRIWNGKYSKKAYLGSYHFSGLN